MNRCALDKTVLSFGVLFRAYNKNRLYFLRIKYLKTYKRYETVQNYKKVFDNFLNAVLQIHVFGKYFKSS